MRLDLRRPLLCALSGAILMSVCVCSVYVTAASAAEDMSAKDPVPVDGEIPTSATDMWFRGLCRNLQVSSTKHVWEHSSDCEPADDPDRTLIISEDCVINPPTEYGQSGSSKISHKLVHSKYKSNDCSGVPTEKIQVIADKCFQQEGGSYRWEAKTGRQKVVSYTQYTDENCVYGVSPTEIPNVFLLPGCYEVGKLECLGNDAVLKAQRAGEEGCLEENTFGIFESIDAACAANSGQLSSFELSSLFVIFLVCADTLAF